VDIRKAIIKAYRKAGSKALTRDQIAESVEGRNVNLERLDVALGALVRSKRLREIEPGTFAIVRERGVAVGELSMTRNGYGFVEAPEGSIYVRGRELGGAMDDDVVAVCVNARRPGDRGLSGEIIEIIERKRTEIVGRFEKLGRDGMVVPSDRRVSGDMFVAGDATMDAATGDMVVARITRYPTSRDAMQGVVTEVLGPLGAPGVDIEVIIREHGLRTHFPPAVIAEADAIPQAADDESGWSKARRDLRDRFTVTIDPIDAKDFDDAISLERIQGGGFRLWVHIADVSHYVPWDSPIDQEAMRRGTSVYLVDRVLPMLPERLSNGICSLNPSVDRLTMTVQIDFDRQGRPGEAVVYDSVIRSDRRLDYGQVDRWLDGADVWPGTADDDVMRTLLTDLEVLAGVLNGQRVARGGLDFDTVEAKVLLDEDMHPVDVVLRERSVATNMIEETAIAANEAVARYMAAGESPMVYRIHEVPDEDALEPVAAILREFSYPIQDIKGATPATFQKIVKFAHDRPEKLLINSLLLRSLKRARYADVLGPHFGLASEAYTHFTSPIRRYPDLVVHRLLKERLAGTLGRDGDPLAPMIDGLGFIADHSSTTEREAQWAEEDSVKLKLTELMADHIGEEFDGVITGVTSFGMFVALANTAEGLVHVSGMTDDFYRLDAEKHQLWGENRGRTYRLGDQVRVRIIDAVPSDLRIDMEVA
jgi:ribonuclease R